MQLTFCVVSLELIMWGAALFFVTIVMVTESGRAVVGEYVSQLIAQFAAQPFPNLPVIIMAVCAVASMVLMYGRTSRRTVVRVIWLEIHSDPDQAPANRSTPDTLALRAR